MPVAYMYILQCADGTYCTGSTKELNKRMIEHQAGKGANYTASRLPVKLVYYEVFERVDHAFCREKQVQKWSRAKKESLMKQDYNELYWLSKKDFGS